MDQEMYKVPHHIITKLEGIIKKYRGKKESMPGVDQITGIVGQDGWLSKTQCAKIKSWWNEGNPKKDQEKKDIYTYSLINWCSDQIDRANAKNIRVNNIRTSTGMKAKTKSQDGREVDRLNSNPTRPSQPAKVERVQYYEGIKDKDLMDDELLKYAKLVHYDLEEGNTDIYNSFLIDLFPPGGGEKVQIQIQSKNHSMALNSARKLHKGHRIGRIKRL